MTKAAKKRKQTNDGEDKADAAVEAKAAAAVPSDGLTKNQRKKAAKKAAAPQFASAIDILHSDLLQEGTRSRLKGQYKTAEPYLHCAIDKLCKPEALARVRDEIVENIQATYKETDLFKVFQTGDLGNLDRLGNDAAAKLPTLMALKEALYSQEFRAFVREITGCGELADKIDCSCNVYAQGGHLLCHDDVIGTRRVSWIIYLTDPEDGWSKQDGGALELYPCEQGKPHTPTVHPTVCHLPTFNSMVMFTVMPGKSFHSVQEVLTSEKPRMSISGWYHAPTEPQDKAHASLQQLQTPAADGGLTAGQDNAGKEGYAPFVSEDGKEEPSAAQDGDGTLTDEDLSFLIRYINPAYLNESAWPKIQEKFKEDGSVQLHKFLSSKWAARISAAARAADKADKLGNGALPEYEAGVNDAWHPVGPPHKQRFLRLADSSSACKTDAVGELLGQVRDTLFRSASFARLLRAFTTLNMEGHRGEARRFRPGLDYTVAHYGILTKDPRLDCVLCFVDDGQQPQQPQPAATTSAPAANGAAGKTGKKGKKAEAAPAATSAPASAAPAVNVWDDGEVGGFEAYLLADEDKAGAAAEEVYRQSADDESGVLNVSAANNSLNLVLRDEGLMKFVKYVSAAAPGSRWDVAMEYLPEDDSDDDEEEEEEKEQKGQAAQKEEDADVHRQKVENSEKDEEMAQQDEGKGDEQQQQEQGVDGGSSAGKQQAPQAQQLTKRQNKKLKRQQQQQQQQQQQEQNGSTAAAKKPTKQAGKKQKVA